MAIDVNALVPVVNEVIEANIPIVTVDRYVSDTNKPVPQFGVDDVAGGAKLARYVIDHFPERREDCLPGLVNRGAARRLIVPKAFATHSRPLAINTKSSLIRLLTLDELKD